MRLTVAVILTLWAATVLADGINTSGNVGQGLMHDGILIPGVAVAFVPPNCSNSLNFTQACNSQYFVLGIL